MTQGDKVLSCEMQDIDENSDDKNDPTTDRINRMISDSWPKPVFEALNIRPVVMLL